MVAPLIPKAYLAGPGIFRPDAEAFGQALQDLCAARGLKGLWPLDNEDTDAARIPDKVRAANRIRRNNEGLILLADAVIADLTPFRGTHMDPGTAYEIGCAQALGKPVFAWSGDPRPLLTRMQSGSNAFYRKSRIVDSAGMTIEHFGLAENLMVATAVECICATPEAAIDACAEALRAIPRKAGRA